MQKRILVTGGFGFIGGHLLEILLQDPTVQVHVVDNLSTSPIPHTRLLDELGTPDNLTYNICSVADYCRANPDATYHEIYHLASPVGPAGVLKHAGRMIKEVVNDVYFLIELALKNDAKLVDISTSEIYGGGQQGYCSEDLPKIVPAETTIRLEYAISKLAAETAIINTCKVTPLKSSIVRPFNVSGPRQSGQGGFVLPRFVSMAMRNEPLTVFGDGQQVRAFTHVKEIADGIMRTMRYGTVSTAYNIGNPNNKVRILDLAQMVVDVVGSRSEIIFVDPATIYGPLYAEANDKYPNAEKAMSELAWNPVIGVEQTIRDTYEYMQQADPAIFDLLAGKPVKQPASSEETAAP